MAKIKTTARYIRRSPYQALAAFVVMAATFFISGLFVLVAVGSNEVIKYFEARPQISAFFKDTAQNDQILALQKTIIDTNLTSEVKFISKEDALKIYQDQNKNDPLLLELVTANILPASLDISTYNATDLEKISEILVKEEIIDEVVYQKDVVEKLTNWTRILRFGGVALVAFLTTVSVLSARYYGILLFLVLDTWRTNAGYANLENASCRRKWQQLNEKTGPYTIPICIDRHFLFWFGNYLGVN